eukprot:TRINITY_DN18109_c0_g1_i1.p1 TRINITY_DN18109_c0_g1~~TRINITY_DN18109_c0_g1_i1.p1  ORF type:complete len:125 (-),score=2.48 TRINITY_DN18109_c0_g1_i1:46-420(-)
MAISMLGLTSMCTVLDRRIQNIGNIPGVYACLAMFGPQYCLDVRLLYRFGMAICTSTVWVLCIVIRRNTIMDEIGVWDAVPLVGICLAVMSFSPDYSLRSAFRTEVQLEALKRIAKSKSGHMAA